MPILQPIDINRTQKRADSVPPWMTARASFDELIHSQLGVQLPPDRRKFDEMLESDIATVTGNSTHEGQPPLDGGI